MTEKNTLEMKLAELAALSETPARTIRLYISMGLLAGPLRPGRNAAYGVAHLEKLNRIRALQGEGMTLSQIRSVLDPAQRTGASLPSSAWRRFDLARDVQVMVQEDIPPWRAHVLRQAIEQFSRLLNSTEERKEQYDG